MEKKGWDSAEKERSAVLTFKLKHGDAAGVDVPKVLLLGEAGVGKTALINTWFTALRNDGAVHHSFKSSPSKKHCTTSYQEVMADSKNFVLCDTWGVDESLYCDGVTEALILDGYMPSMFHMDQKPEWPAKQSEAKSAADGPVVAGAEVHINLASTGEQFGLGVPANGNKVVLCSASEGNCERAFTLREDGRLVSSARPELCLALDRAPDNNAQLILEEVDGNFDYRQCWTLNDDGAGNHVIVSKSFPKFAFTNYNDAKVHGNSTGMWEAAPQWKARQTWKLKLTERNGMVPIGQKPPKRDCVHALLLVVHWNQLDDLSYWQKYKYFLDAADKRGTSVLVAVTHCDLSGTEPSQMYDAAEVTKKRNKVRDVIGINAGQVFPVINYSAQLQTNVGIDKLALNLLRALLNGADAYFTRLVMGLDDSQRTAGKFARGSNVWVAGRAARVVSERFEDDTVEIEFQDDGHKVRIPAISLSDKA